MNHKDKIRDADGKTMGAAKEATGEVVAGRTAHETEGQGSTSTTDRGPAADTTHGSAEEATGEVVAGRTAHDTAGQGSKSTTDPA